MDDLDFTPYEKMPKTLKKLGLTTENYTQLEKMEWVVTEKIHGANFSFIYQNQQLHFAKRKALLKWTDDFFGFQTVIQRIENQIIQLFEVLSNDIKATQYIIYGELFGGYYPHDKVEQNDEVQAIQTGIYYTPDIHFCAFDIAIINEDNQKIYLDYSEALDYFEQFQLVHAQPLFKGNFNEVVEFDIQINSIMPSLFNLPQIEPNLIEGIVVKPLAHTHLNLPIRPIIKIKNPVFEENEQYHQAEK